MPIAGPPLLEEPVVWMSALTCDPPTPEFTFMVALAVLFVRFGSTIIERVLIATQWNCKMADMQLKISDKALLYKMKQTASSLPVLPVLAVPDFAAYTSNRQ
jgi:hypothetical protein